ncbi:mechanosensitive ion channel [Mucilaginibacter corticis]|uniref:Mechanosensitive ion channel n=1 Tax=Mucilaginibacter corticis TaxID=2597670 RepID=A0A556MLH6_9SPHI|nr:mechanosensitive ion channel domain-containing protein [Mucilaginibacter corticis]TSJ40698.1 mechanosensitive ion channel [Mucilaginibacter corticis]
MQRILKFTVLVITLFSFSLQNGYAQDSRTNSKTLRKKERKAVHTRDSIYRTFNQSDTSINNLLQRLETYTATFKQTNNNLAAGLDTADISQRLPSTIRRINKIKDQANTHKASTLRYLFVLRDNLDHLQGVVKGWQTNLDAIDDKLVQNQSDIVKFPKDSLLLKTIPTDSVLRSTFFSERLIAFNLYLKTDSANRKNLFKINILQNRVATAYANILDESDQIDDKVSKFASRAFDGEFGYIWEIDKSYNNLSTSVQGTIDLNNSQLYYFIKKETATHLVAIVFIVIAFSWIFYNRGKTKRNAETAELIFSEANYIDKLPVISSLLVGVAIVPYFYSHPPAAFLEILFIISLVLVLVLIKKAFNYGIFKALLSLFYVTIFYSISNLLIQTTNADRFAILILDIISVVIAYKFNKKVSAAPADYPKNTDAIVKIFIVLQVLSLVLDISGRFSLSKIVGVTAVYNLWFLISLHFVVEIISQGLLLQFKNPKNPDSIISWIDHTLMLKKIRYILNVGAALLWLFFLAQNLNIDDFALDYIHDILIQPRTVAGISGASFTFGGFVIFIAVIWLSSVMSKLISYFYDISVQHASSIDKLKKKNRTSTLLIRIGVFTIGFFLAVFASNFPLDKITIIISAFGIGIGFGLQNIVNNLVSGLILAFEKPVQIGDVIEIDSRSGTIKEIGIRSSKIATSDGAEVIIPNGDLISHHVINWTLSNNNRRVELIVSVAYGSDIKKVEDLLRSILCNRDDIMADPEPLIFLNTVNENSVDFRLLFWAADISHWLRLKSNVLADIYTEFNKEGIELPHSIQDLKLNLPEGKTLNLSDLEEPPTPPEKI